LKTAKFYKLVQGESATTFRARLDSIQECDGSAASAKCKNATVFSYEPGVETMVEAPNVPPAGVQCTPIPETVVASYAADLNRDGKSDVVFRGVPTGEP